MQRHRQMMGLLLRHFDQYIRILVLSKQSGGAQATRATASDLLCTPSCVAGQ
jgi:hypothetical protein